MRQLEVPIAAGQTSSPRIKSSFLIYDRHKYIIVRTESIAFFYIKFETPVIVCFDGKEYFVGQSLDQLQGVLPAHQFYRLNRQFLVNFDAVKEVEHYFARKLLVNIIVPVKEKLIVSKEKVTQFLEWLDNR